MARRLSFRSSAPSLTIVSTDPEQLANMSCPRCQAWLDIHQPSITSPHRLLATCTQCDAWYYLEAEPDTGLATMVYLPERELRPASSSPCNDDEQPCFAIVGLS